MMTAHMVVIDNGRDYLGKAVDVAITSVLQTTGGRMIFSKMKDDLKNLFCNRRSIVLSVIAALLLARLFCV